MLGPIVAVIAHRLIRLYCPVGVQKIDLYFGAGLQIFGGLLVLYAMNSSLKFWNIGSINGLVKGYFCSIPLIRRHYVLQIHDCSSASEVGTQSLKVRVPPSSPEERIAALENELKEMRAEFQENVDRLAADMVTLSNTMKAEHGRSQKKVAALEGQIRKDAHGSVGVQVLGVLLAVYGAIIPVLSA